VAVPVVTEQASLLFPEVPAAVEEVAKQPKASVSSVNPAFDGLSAGSGDQNSVPPAALGSVSIVNASSTHGRESSAVENSATDVRSVSSVNGHNQTGTEAGEASGSADEANHEGMNGASRVHAPPPVESTAEPDPRPMEAVETHSVEGESTGGGKGTEGLSSAWSEPQPLVDPVEVTFDHALLPDVLRDWLVDASNRRGTVIEMALPAMFLALGAVIGNFFVVLPRQYDHSFRVYMMVWGLLVAPSGSRKSAQDDMLGPIYQIQRRLNLEDAERNAENEIQRNILEKKRRGLEESLVRAAKNGLDDADTREAEKQLHQIMKKEAELSPRTRRLLVNDSTTEKLTMLASQFPRGITCYRDELHAWFENLTRKSREGDQGYYLEGWNAAKTFTQDRVGRGSIEVERHTVAVGGNIPGSMLREAIKTAGRASGLLQRFQAAVVIEDYPSHLAADREPDERALTAYEALLTGIFELTSQDEDVVERELRFSPAASKLYREWEAELQKRRNTAGSVSEDYAGHISKYTSFCAAIAGIYHVVEMVSSGATSIQVSADAAKRAIKTVAFFEEHAKRLYGIHVDPKLDLAQKLFGQLISSKGTAVPVRDLYRSIGKSVQVTEPALELLEERGWVKLYQVKPSNGGRPSTMAVPHPAWKTLKP